MCHQVQILLPDEKIFYQIQILLPDAESPTGRRIHLPEARDTEELYLTRLFEKYWDSWVTLYPPVQF